MNKFTETSLILNLWCVFLYALLLSVCWHTNITNSQSYLIYRNHKAQERFLFFGFLIYAMTFWINSDFFGYIEYAKESDTDFSYNLLAPMEYGHQIICSIVNGNWIGFRFFCWGGALVLYVMTARQLQINVLNSLFVLFASFSYIFSYGRVTLAMAFFFYGIACIIGPGRNGFFRGIIGVLFVIGSFFFHSSALLMIALTPIAFIPKKYSKISIFTILIFIAIVIVLTFSIDLMYANSNSLDDTTSSKLNRYSEKDIDTANIWGIISATIAYTGQFLPVFLILKSSLNKRGTLKPYIAKMTILTSIIVFVSIGFYFSGKGQFVLFYRTLNMAMIPTSLLISYFYLNGIFKKSTYYWSIAFGITSIMQKYAWIIFRDL